MPLLVLLPRRLLVSRLTDVVAGNVPARTTRATIGTYRRKTRFFPNVGRIVADKIHGLASRLKQDSTLATLTTINFLNWFHNYLNIKDLT